MHVDSLPIHLFEHGANTSGVVHWVVGNLREGEPETLGLWLTAEPGQPNWRDVFDELKDRGVERIQFAICGDMRKVREDLRAKFPGAMAVPSFARLIDRSAAQVATRHRAAVKGHLLAIISAASGPAAHSALAELEVSSWGARYPALAAEWRLALEQGWSLLALSPPLRREVLSGDGKSSVLNRSLHKAISRRGCFASPEAAVSFVTAALVRAERNLDKGRAASVTEQNHHHEVSRPTIAALGL